MRNVFTHRTFLFDAAVLKSGTNMSSQQQSFVVVIIWIKTGVGTSPLGVGHQTLRPTLESETHTSKR